MDSKNNKRYILGILIMTIIFGVFAILAVGKLFNDQEQDKPLVKTDYILMLESELNISLDSEDDFTNFDNVVYAVLVEPTKYQYYYKPCFEFKIVSDGVVIKNGLAKDFSVLGLQEGMKITKVNDQTLSGKSYFEILELIYSKTENEVKVFTFQDETTINYEYKYYENKMSYDQDKNILYVYNLDEVTIKAVHEMVMQHPDLTLDLSEATVTTFEGVVNFISLFSDKNEVLFNSPLIIGQNNRKINELNIVVGNNDDRGVLFSLTCISRINKNIVIDRTSLNITTFYVAKVLVSQDYTIYLKNILLEAKSAPSSGGTGSII